MDLRSYQRAGRRGHARRGSGGRFASSPDGARLLATRIGERTWIVDVAERAVRGA